MFNSTDDKFSMSGSDSVFMSFHTGCGHPNDDLRYRYQRDGNFVLYKGNDFSNVVAMSGPWPTRDQNFRPDALRLTWDGHLRASHNGVVYWANGRSITPGDKSYENDKAGVLLLLGTDKGPGYVECLEGWGGGTIWKCWT